MVCVPAVLKDNFCTLLVYEAVSVPQYSSSTNATPVELGLVTSSIPKEDAVPPVVTNCAAV